MAITEAIYLMQQFSGTVGPPGSGLSPSRAH
jgi:hypothetical protein